MGPVITGSFEKRAHGTRTNNKLNPHMTPGPGIEPGTHWWEAILGDPGAVSGEKSKTGEKNSGEEKLLHHTFIYRYVHCIYLTWIVQGRFQRSGRQALEEVYQLFFQPCVQQDRKKNVSPIVRTKSLQAQHQYCKEKCFRHWLFYDRHFLCWVSAALDF